MATCYGLDGPRIEIFHTLLVLPWDPHSLLYNGKRISFRGYSGLGVELTLSANLALRLKKK